MTASSLTGLMRYDAIGESKTGLHGCHHLTRGGEIMSISGPRISEARCNVIEKLLLNEHMRHVKWTFWIDSDMGVPTDSICQLLGHAYDGNADANPDEPALSIIGGLAFAGAGDRLHPTIYADNEDGFPLPITTVYPDLEDGYPRDTLVKTAGTGAAFLMVHRKVYEAMGRPWPDGFGTDPNGHQNPHPWFVEGIKDGAQFGEDIAFCRRARALGFDTYVHTGVKSDHWKDLPMNEEMYDMKRWWLTVRHRYGYGGEPEAPPGTVEFKETR